MTPYDNYKDDPFYTFYKKYAFVNENEFVTTDLHLLSANVPNITESFIYIHLMVTISLEPNFIF